jgi:DNA repair protein RecO (recombination protein O)
MTHKTKGIILRTVKYGETSLIVTILTELFGIQSYIVNGVRSSKPSAKAAYFQPAAILDLIVYHHPQKNLQRIKEFRWGVVYQHILSEVVKNSVALYMVELLQKCMKQPETQPELYQFCEAAFTELDTADKTITANFALYFSLQFSYFLGFRPQPELPNGEYADLQPNLHFDLQEGAFVLKQPGHPHFAGTEMAQLLAQLLKIMHPNELTGLKLHHTLRRKLLLICQEFYALHVAEFGQMQTLMVMQQVLA